MKIGEVARKVGLATSAIRFYEEAGLLPEPERTPSGYRSYHPSVIDRLAFIRAGQAVGLTLSELHDVLQIRDRGEAPCRHVAELIGNRIREIDERIGDLRLLRKDLAALAETAAHFDPAECTPESVCKILKG
ncbi:MAG: heavy metal-responsive transcriptional regulator [Actinomycetota bacterium]|nr:heavy metal-responsive transcriptional regulator [Actinomycetota bacterium]